MNIRDLEYIAAVDRYRHFGRAADACHVSQPSLSAQVKKLEDRLGIELFARTNSGVRTTDAGTRIVSTARDVLRSAQRISDTAAEYHDPMAAPLRIGMIPTLAPFALPYLTSTISEVAQDLQVIIREQTTQVLWSELDERLVDVALMSNPETPAGYRFTPIFEEPLLLMVSKDHRLANSGAIKAHEIPVEEMLLLTKEHCLRDEAITLCNDKNIGIDVPDQLLAHNFLTLSHLLNLGVGCALVPTLARSILECANPAIRFVEIEDSSFARKIGFVSREGCPRQQILLRLCDYIRANLPENVTVLR